jgi:regulatory protein
MGGSHAAGGDQILGRTAIPGRPDWLRVSFARRDPLDLPIRVWVEYDLKVGQELDDFLLSDLLRVTDEAAGYELALRYLSNRPHTRAEVERYLRRKGYGDSTVASILQRLSERGVLDDSAYTARFIERRAARMSRREMSWRLQQKGVRGRDMAPYLDAEDVRQMERSTAETLARKQWRRLADEDPPVRLRKVAAYLGRRGFPADVVVGILRRLVAETGDDPHELDEW